MSEVIKDAPCLCKDDEMERIQPKRNFFQKILYSRLRKRNRCYLYPVLYSDRTISNAICDRIGRKPLGVVFENHLITLRASSKRMKWDEAMDYCKSVKIFGQSCEAGTIEFWKKCIGKKKSKAINKMLASLGGKRIKTKRKYWSSSKLSSLHGFSGRVMVLTTTTWTPTIRMTTLLFVRCLILANYLRKLPPDLFG